MVSPLLRLVLALVAVAAVCRAQTPPQDDPFKDEEEQLEQEENQLLSLIADPQFQEQVLECRRQHPIDDKKLTECEGDYTHLLLLTQEMQALPPGEEPDDETMKRITDHLDLFLKQACGDGCIEEWRKFSELCAPMKLRLLFQAYALANGFPITFDSGVDTTARYACLASPGGDSCYTALLLGSDDADGLDDMCYNLENGANCSPDCKAGLQRLTANMGCCLPELLDSGLVPGLKDTVGNQAYWAACDLPVPVGFCQSLVKAGPAAPTAGPTPHKPAGPSPPPPGPAPATTTHGAAPIPTTGSRGSAELGTDTGEPSSDQGSNAGSTIVAAFFLSVLGVLVVLVSYRRFVLGKKGWDQINPWAPPVVESVAYSDLQTEDDLEDLLAEMDA